MWFCGYLLFFTETLGICPGKQIFKSSKKTILKMKEIITELTKGKYLIISWFLISIIVIGLIIFGLPYTVGKNYSCKEIVENIYPEIYGLLFDVILFGIVISIYQISRDKKEAIESEEDQIDDFRGWKSNEASHRILGSVKRLQRLGKTQINLTSCFFQEVILKDLCIEDSNLTGLTLLKTKLFNNTFYKIESNSINCRDSTIYGTSFQEGEIYFNLHNTDFFSSLLQKINLRASSFCPKKISFSLFESVDFSHSYFKFEKITFTEFINCKFNECVVPENFFSLISKEINKNLGYKKIIEEYDLVHELSPKTGNKKPTWILRNKKEGKTPKPIHRVKAGSAIVAIDPWGRTNRYRPNFDKRE